jgi:hypothetical protein
MRRLKTRRTPTQGASSVPSTPVAELRKAIDQARTKITSAKARLRELLRNTPRDEGPNRAEIFGLLASTAKYDAEILHRLSLDENREYYRDDPTQMGRTESTLRQRSIRELEDSRDDYAHAFGADRDASWALVQDLCLSAVLSGPDAITFESWTTAKALSEADLTLPHTRGDWAHANLVELYLLSQLKTPSTDGFPWPDAVQASNKALAHVEELVKMSERGSKEVYSLRRQITRYIEWFSDIDLNNGFVNLDGQANEILGRMPEWSKPGNESHASDA